MKYKKLILKNFASLTNDVEKNKLLTKDAMKKSDKEYKFLKDKNDSWFNKI